jgi:hypothetical protein
VHKDGHSRSCPRGPLTPNQKAKSNDRDCQAYVYEKLMISRESPEDYQERADRRKTDMQIAHDPGRHFAPKHISRQN